MRVREVVRGKRQQQLSFALLLVLGSIIIAPLRPTASAEAQSNLQYLGALPQAPGLPTEISLVDAARHRAYGHRHVFGKSGRVSGDEITEYDLDRPVSRMKVRDAVLPFSEVGLVNIFEPNQAALDEPDDLVFYLDYAEQNTGCPLQSFVRTLSLKTLRPAGHVWDLNLQVPGFYAEGITYSPSDRLVYLVGALGCEAFNTAQTLSTPVLPVTVVALDAKSGSLVWTKTLTKCLHNVAVYGKGGAIYKSVHFSALYFGCMRSDLSYGTAPYAGQSGIERLWADRHADTQAALTFREEFFPISGGFSSTTGNNGQLLYDQESERLLLVTHSDTTPGAWVFDGGTSSWVGFIPARDAGNGPVGIDPSSGHVFMRNGADGSIIVTDIRATPVPQGTPYAFHFGIPEVSGFLVADPIDHLLFPLGEVKSQHNTQSKEFPVVLRDNTLSPPPEPNIDYDSLTSDIPESASTLVAFSGTATGYGANFSFIGGTGGVTAPLYQNVFTTNTLPRNSAVSPGDRGVALSVLPSIDLRNVGASATAQEVMPDTSTDNDRRTKQGQIAESGSTIGQQAATQQVAAYMEWPWPAATCLDAGGQALDKGGPQQGGQATVHCDLGKDRASASASSGIQQIDGVTIAGSSITSQTFKDAAGIVTETLSQARGVSLEAPGSGSLRIGSIELFVKTVAHGRSKTASIEWARKIEGAVLKDAEGHEVFSCPVCNPNQLANQVNAFFDLKVRMHIPNPQITKTPHGAYASFSKSDVDYVNDLVALNDTSRAMPALQIEIYNDYQDRSRFLVQLAGIQADSIYGISLLPSDNFVQPPPLPLPKIAVPPPPVQVATNLPAPPPPPARPGLIHQLVTSALLLVRSPKDALLIALTAMLFVGAATITARRRELNTLTNGRRDL